MEVKIMKKIFVCLSSVFLLFSFLEISNADPLQVEVIDSYYHVWGKYLLAGSSFYNTYDDSSDVPIEIDFQYSDVGQNVFTDSLTYEFGFNIEAHSGGYNSPPLTCYAEAEWIFRPINDVDQLLIQPYLNGPPYFEDGIFLEDLTTGQTIGNYFSHGKVGSSYSPEYKYYDGSEYFSVDCLGYPSDFTIENDFISDHLYRLYIYGRTGSNQDSIESSIRVDMVSVPEPATMLLIGSGLVGLAGFRKKFDKK